MWDSSDDGSPRDDGTHEAITCDDTTPVNDGPADGGERSDTINGDHTDIYSDDGNGHTNCMGDNG